MCLKPNNGIRVRLGWEGWFLSGKKKFGVQERGMTSVKNSSISIEHFDGRGDFTLWQQQVEGLLT